MSYDIFLSYASPNRQYVRAVAEALSDRGWSVWYADNGEPRSTVPEVIEAALRDSKAMLVLWSHKAARSKYVIAEIKSSLGAGRPLFLARVDGAEVPDEFAVAQLFDLDQWTKLPATDFERSSLDPHQSYDVAALSISAAFLKLTVSIEVSIGKGQRKSTTDRRSRSGWLLWAGAAGGMLVVVAALVMVRPWRFVFGAQDDRSQQPTSGYVGGRVPGASRVIVFIHGVLGDAVSTWTSPTTKAYWPALLRQDETFKAADVFVYSYHSSLYRSRLTIDNLASNLETVLTASGVIKDHDHVIFVGHSMGGLIAAEFIVTFQSQYAAKIPLIFFVATPSTGSEFAALADVVKSNNPQFKNLALWSDTAFVTRLANLWGGANLKGRSYCAYEKSPTFGRVIVNEVSATYICNTGVPIEANHIDIAKPSGPNDGGVYDAFKAAYIKTFDNNGPK